MHPIYFFEKVVDSIFVVSNVLSGDFRSKFILLKSELYAERKSQAYIAPNVLKAINIDATVV